MFYEIVQKISSKFVQIYFAQMFSVQFFFFFCLNVSTALNQAPPSNKFHIYNTEKSISVAVLIQ